MYHPSSRFKIKPSCALHDGPLFGILFNDEDETSADFQRTEELV
jgi:hypothetical protein